MRSFFWFFSFMLMGIATLILAFALLAINAKVDILRDRCREIEFKNSVQDDVMKFLLMKQLEDSGFNEENLFGNNLPEA